MHRLRAAAMLLLVAAAWAPLVQSGTSADPEVSDPAGDQVVTRPGNPQIPPVIPGVNDESFADVDILGAWFEEPRNHDCVGAAANTCPFIDLIVATSSGWLDGTMTASFKLEQGPTSYAHSNATGQTFNLTIQGTTVTGLANTTASATLDGLRIRMPIPRLGAVGGDLLTNLSLTTARTDAGSVTDPTVTQDDQTGTDEAGPGDGYTVFRPAREDRWGVRVASIDGTAGNSITSADRRTIVVMVEVTNLGTDPANFILHVRSEGVQTPSFRSHAVQGNLDPLQSTSIRLNVSMDEMDAGTALINFYLFDNEPGATARIVFAPTAADRDVVPAGLDFLTPAAESVGLDNAFGKYAELVFLALLVLLVILAIFLLVALAPSTLAGASDPEAPPVKASEAAPAGVLPVVAPTKADGDEPEPMELTPEPAVATKGGALKIESVQHTPEAPEEGEEVTTEVVLRNAGPTRQVRVVLAADELDRDEKALTLPARATKTVKLSWTAGPGENKVRVRVLPA